MASRYRSEQFYLGCQNLTVMQTDAWHWIGVAQSDYDANGCMALYCGGAIWLWCKQMHDIGLGWRNRTMMQTDAWHWTENDISIIWERRNLRKFNRQIATLTRRRYRPYDGVLRELGAGLLAGDSHGEAFKGTRWHILQVACCRDLEMTILNLI